MSTNTTRAVPVEAGSAITIRRFISIAADGQADHVGTAQAAADGISAETQATAGREIAMNIPDGGFYEVESGVALAIGADVASNNAGKAIAWVDAAGNACLGKVVAQASAADGDVVTIQFSHRKVGAGS